jgi:hypothetical protein
MLLSLIAEFKFEKQWRSLAVSNGDAFLAGGIEPSGGSRSTFSRSIGRFSLKAGDFRWENTQAKAKPLREVCVFDRYVAATLPTNFTGQPQGAMIFEAETGEQLPIMLERGAVDCLASLATGTLVASFADRGVYGFTWWNERDGVSVQTFEDGHRQIQCLVPFNDLLVFSRWTNADKVGFIHECLESDLRTTRWQLFSKKRRLCQAGNELLTYPDSSKPNQQLEIVDLQTGRSLRKVPCPLPLDSVFWLGNDWIASHTNENQFSLINLTTKESHSYELPPGSDFVSFAVDEHSNSLLVLGCGSPQHPQSWLRVYAREA